MKAHIKQIGKSLWLLIDNDSENPKAPGTITEGFGIIRDALGIDTEKVGDTAWAIKEEEV